MLAYSLNPDLTDPTQISDQTLWFIDQSADGQFTGVALVHLSTEELQERNISGIITPDRQVHITFSSNDPNVAPRDRHRTGPLRRRRDPLANADG